MGVLTGTVPIVLYSIQRIRRFLRAHLNRDDVKIVKATVRPGKGGGPDGALTYLQISKPRALWQNWPGAYAFINMPEYAYLQCLFCYDELEPAKRMGVKFQRVLSQRSPPSFASDRFAN